MLPEKNIAILCNPLAGAGRALPLAEKIGAKLSERQIPHHIFSSNWPPEFAEFTELWIVGGDGTLNYFVNHYPSIGLPLVIFNGGTGNDVHWLLYGKMDLEEQIEKVLVAATKPVDLGRCNDRYFLNGVGVGFEGIVAKDLSGKIKRPGKASFMTAILRRIFFYRSRSYQTFSEELNTTGARLIIDVANGQRAGGGFHIAPLSAIDDGWLDVVLVNKLHPFMRLSYLPIIEKGKHLHLPFIKHYRTRKILIESEEEISAHLDGEYYSAKRLEIEILPGSLLFRY
jgi:diacylglycerol kinase (ATP)